MKIMHVVSPANAGGLERVVHALAIGHQRRGHHVIAVPIAPVWNPKHSFAAPLTRSDIEIRPLVVPGRAYLKQRAALARLFEETAPDIVHTHGYHTDVVAGGVARRAGIATVSTSHGFTRGPWRNRVYEQLDRLVLRRFDAVAAVSRPLADELLRAGVPGDRLHVVPNAWSQVSMPLNRSAARKELGLDPDRFVAGWVGRMTYEKGLDVLVDAVAEITDLPVTLCIIGDGPERAAQEARAVTAGTAKQIHWAGLISEAVRFFSAFDVLVLSSRTEGVPMVVLEAMAAGIPLVVSAVGGIPDVVSSREAILVPSERPDELAAAVRDVFVDRTAATNRAQAALERLGREFAEEPWLMRYEEVYQAAREAAARRTGTR